MKSISLCNISINYIDRFFNIHGETMWIMEAMFTVVDQNKVYKLRLNRTASSFKWSFASLDFLYEFYWYEFDAERNYQITLSNIDYTINIVSKFLMEALHA